MQSQNVSVVTTIPYPHELMASRAARHRNAWRATEVVSGEAAHGLGDGDVPVPPPAGLLPSSSDVSQESPESPPSGGSVVSLQDSPVH